VAEETQEAVIEVQEDENSSCDREQKSPTSTSTARNGSVVVENGSRQRASGSRVIVSHSPEGSIARVVSSLDDSSVSRLSSVGSGCSYSLSPDGSSMSRPASSATGLRQVSNFAQFIGVFLGFGGN